MNLEFHHRLEHDLRHDELGSILAVDVAHNLPAVKTFLLTHAHKTVSDVDAMVVLGLESFLTAVYFRNHLFFSPSSY